MARPKGSKNKASKKATDPNVEETYDETVEFMCPVRGLVKQKVKVKKMKPISDEQTRPVTSNEDTLADIEKEDDGLVSFDENEGDE